jgi:hypothetical protein
VLTLKRPIRGKVDGSSQGVRDISVHHDGYMVHQRMMDDEEETRIIS